jgi:ComF family protein
VSETRLLRARARDALSAAVGAVLAFVFPDECVSCGRALGAGERHVCEACSALLRVAARRTAMPPVPAAMPSLQAPLSEDPGAGRAASTTAVYALRFSGPARDLVHCMKYQGRASVARALADMCAPLLRSASLGRFDLVVPVPLHATRLRERGFNHSDLVARRLAELAGVPCARALRRIRATASQTSLTRHGRLVNVDGAFAPTRNADVDGLDVLLVDDVVTTGATLAAAASALVSAGATSVTCFAVAGQSDSGSARSGGRAETG